jgi:hypothetical protein
LFQESTRNEIQNVLCALYHDLVSSGEAFLSLDISNVIAVKLIRQPRIPSVVRDYEVPILCVDCHHKYLLAQLPWDISVRHLLNFIDGISHVKKIALKPEASMDVEIVKQCLRILVHYNCVILSDILRFSNIYQLTAQGKEFVMNVGTNKSASFHLLLELIRFCSSVDQRPDGGSNSTLDKPSSPVRTALTDKDNLDYSHHGANNKDVVSRSVGQAAHVSLPLSGNTPMTMKQYVRCIQRFLCALQPGRPFSAVINSLGKDFKWYGINIRRLLAYCQHRGIIRRVYEYPVNMYGTASDNSLGTGEQASNVNVLSGRQSLDSICTAHSLEASVITNMQGVCIVLK